MHRACICCAALVAMLWLGTLGAQETPALVAGSRVRVQGLQTGLSGRTGRTFSVVGVLESIDSATIVVRDKDSATVTVSRGPGTRLYVSGGPGKCSGGRRGGCVFVGFLGGAALGVAVGAAASSGQGCSDEPCALAYLITVPAGALLGTIIGASVGGEHWQKVEEPVRVSLGPGGSGRFTLGVSVSF